MNRRNFLRSSSLLGLPMVASPFTATMARQLQSLVDPDSDRILVLVQLTGGNDGLNTLVPLDAYDTLMNLRTNLMVPENNLLSLNDTQALHPSLTGWRELYDAGQMGVVQGVGYPNQNRSHFRSTDIWTSASAAEEVINTGWLGRHFAADHGDFPEGYPNEEYPAPFAIAIGNKVTQTCQGVGVNFSISLTNPLNQTELAGSGDYPLPDSPYGEELGFLRTSIAQTNAYGSHVEARALQGSNTVDYPDTRLAEGLKNVALLISGGLETKVFIVNQGGYDTHANQVVDGSPVNGIHANLLQELGDALAAFHADLRGLGLSERVLSMTFSEFGRRIRSNAAVGSDHGSAAPLFLFGDCVAPGALGTNPEIGSDVSEQEGVAMQYDFRDVYGTVLEDWFGLTGSEVNTVLGHEYVHLPILRVCGTATSTEEPFQDFRASIYPNPFAHTMRVKFTSGGARTDLSVFDVTGRRVHRAFDRELLAGPHEVDLQLGHLPAGAYFVRLQSGATVLTERVVKR